MRNTATAAVNLLTLLVGIVIGFALSHASPVRAQAASQQQYEEIAPVVTAGSAGFGIVLSSRMATDEITVRGVDLVKLHEGTLNLLASKPLFFSQAELQAVITNAKVAKPLRMKQAEQPKEKK